MPIEVQIADPRLPEAAALVGALDQFLFDRCGAVYTPGVAVARLAQQDTVFLLARLDGRAAGCIALEVDGEAGEVKCVYVDPTSRGSGLGAALLVQIEAVARQLKLRVIRLETNRLLVEALGLYKSSGMTPCAPFGRYVAGPSNLYLEKRLTRRAAA